MIDEKQWLELKEQEKYYMFSELLKRLDDLEHRFYNHVSIKEYCPHTEVWNGIYQRWEERDSY